MSKKIEVEIPEGFHLEPAENGYKLVKDELSLEEIFKDSETYPLVLPLSKYTTNIDLVANKLKILNELICVADYLNKGWKPNWEDDNEEKYHIVCRYNSASVERSCSWGRGLVYFKSDELALKAIKIIGEEILIQLYL